MLRFTAKPAHGLFIPTEDFECVEQVMAYLMAQTLAYPRQSNHLGKYLRHTLQTSAVFHGESEGSMNEDAVTWRHAAGESMLFSVQV